MWMLRRVRTRRTTDWWTLRTKSSLSSRDRTRSKNPLRDQVPAIVICPSTELISTVAPPLPKVRDKYFSEDVAPRRFRTWIEPTLPFSTVATSLNEDVFGTVSVTAELVDVRL